MPTTSANAAISKLLGTFTEIGVNLFHAVLAIVQAFIGLFSTTINSVVQLFTALSAAVMELVQSVVGFVLANIVVIAVLGLLYYFWTRRSEQPSARRTRKK